MDSNTLMIIDFLFGLSTQEKIEVHFANMTELFESKTYTPEEQPDPMNHLIFSPSQCHYPLLFDQCVLPAPESFARRRLSPALGTVAGAQ